MHITETILLPLLITAFDLTSEATPVLSAVTTSLVDFIAARRSTSFHPMMYPRSLSHVDSTLKVMPTHTEKCFGVSRGIEYVELDRIRVPRGAVDEL